MGNATYVGDDRIRPSQFFMVFVTFFMILFPSALYVSYVPIVVAGPIAGTFIILIYAASMINALRCLWLCSTIEPGIIPAIRSEKVDYERPSYMATFKNRWELARESEDKPDLTPA